MGWVGGVGKAHKPGSYGWMQRIRSVGGRKEGGTEMQQSRQAGAFCAYEGGGFHPKPRWKGSGTALTQQVAGPAQPVAQVSSLPFCPHADHKEPRAPLPGVARGQRSGHGLRTSPNDLFKVPP